VSYTIGHDELCHRSKSSFSWLHIEWTVKIHFQNIIKQMFDVRLRNASVRLSAALYAVFRARRWTDTLLPKFRGYCVTLWPFLREGLPGLWLAHDKKVFEIHFASVLSPIFTRRFLSRLKHRGPQDIPPSRIIPQQRAEPEKFPFLIGEKFVFLTMAAGDNFSNLGPFRTPRKRPQLAPNSRLSKSWLACAASYIAESTKKVIKNKLSCRKS
jgi:hypothetical protein